MNINGYELIKDWEVSNIGHTAIATKGGKKYFLKRYGLHKMPQMSESVGPKQYEKLKAKFDAFKDYRIAINKELGSIAGPGGNIILPVHWFVHDIYYIEATEWIENAVKEEDVLRSTHDEIMLILMTAAGSLRSIHRKNIVHSDLKMGNIMVATNSSGNKVAKIFDFDKAYFPDRIRPDDIGGDQSFMSPELVCCFVYDMAEEALAYLSAKSDIFSLGLIFHIYLTGGELPKINGLTGALKDRADKGAAVYCGEAILYGAELEVSAKIKDQYLSHLVAAMLEQLPENRPTSDEVLEVLKTKRVIERKPDSLVKIADGKSASSDTREKTKVKEETTSTDTERETAKEPEPTPMPPEGKYCEPWPEHKIAFDEERMAAMGFVSSVQISRAGKPCYTLYTADGKPRPFTLQNLLMLELAVKVSDIPEPTPEEKAALDGAELWPEDSEYCFNTAAIMAAGYREVSKATKGGSNAYALIKSESEQVVLPFRTLKMLGFVKKK